MDPSKIVTITLPDEELFLIKENDRWVPLKERYLSKVIPHFTDLMEKARKKYFSKWLEKCQIIRKAKSDRSLPNAHQKLWLGAKKAPPTKELLIQGAEAFLALSRLTEDKKLCYQIMMLLICAPHVRELRNAYPEFMPVMKFRDAGSGTAEILTELVSLVVRRKKWSGKHCKIRRSKVLDFALSKGWMRKRIQDFSTLTVKCKGSPRIPFPYTNTLALIINADNRDLKDAWQYLRESAYFMLNCSAKTTPDGKLPSEMYFDNYNDKALEELHLHGEHIAAILRWWAVQWDGYPKWAANLVMKARTAFRSNDPTFVRLNVDPKRMTDAIMYETLRSFFMQIAISGYLRNEQITELLADIRKAFDPAPVQPTELRKAEDPAVFLELMRKIVSSASIVEEGTPFVKHKPALGAWRTISGKRYLVILEETWEKVYRKAVKEDPLLDGSYFCNDHWSRDLQGLLKAAEIIKAASSGNRYRYNIYSKPGDAKEYVVAIPAELMLD